MGPGKHPDFAVLSQTFWSVLLCDLVLTGRQWYAWSQAVDTVKSEEWMLKFLVWNFGATTLGWLLSWLRLGLFRSGVS